MFEEDCLKEVKGSLGPPLDTGPYGPSTSFLTKTSRRTGAVAKGRVGLLSGSDGGRKGRSQSVDVVVGYSRYRHGTRKGSLTVSSDLK